MTLFFSGIGGSGMLPLAMILKSRGVTLKASDRSRDQGKTPEKFAWLEAQGVTFYPQDGSGITTDLEALVISAAVEATVPDVAESLLKGLPIRKRAEVLADCLNQARERVVVAGTSGKSTTTGMLGYLLQELGKAPTVMNGAVFNNYAATSPFCSALIGNGPAFVIEGDESDGSLALYNPSLAVLMNISLDHADMDELRRRFGTFLNKAPQAVLNADSMEVMALAQHYKGKALTCSLTEPAADLFAHDITPLADGISAKVTYQGTTTALRLSVPGRHNLANALHALGAALLLGCGLEDSCAKLTGFTGVKRRLDLIGQTETGIRIIDDFAHNPDKIAATLSCLKEFDGRLVVYYQPHGFGPLRMCRQELVDSFCSHLAPDDVLIMAEPYYAGGTVDRSVSSRHIVSDILLRGHNAHLVETRDDGRTQLLAHIKAGDRVVIMGARDDTLTTFAQELLTTLKERAAA